MFRRTVRKAIQLLQTLWIREMEEERRVFCVQGLNSLVFFRLRQIPSQRSSFTESPFNEKDKQFLMILPQWSSPYGAKDAKQASSLQEILQALNRWHLGPGQRLYQWEEEKQPSFRRRTISEAVSSSSQSNTLQRNRIRLISEGATEAKQMLASYKEGCLIPIPANLNVDSRIEINDIVCKLSYETHILFFEDAFLKYKRDADKDMFAEIINPTLYSNLYGNGSISDDTQCNIHPAFRHQSHNRVFHSLSEISACLRASQHKSLKYLDGFVDKARDNIAAIESSSTAAHPFIVIEGLDGTGKSTVTKALAEEFGAKQLQTPPQEMTHLRTEFDGLPAVCRRLYYFLGNYVAVPLIHETRLNHAVVMDRFWHSTAAYTIATDCGVGDETLLPPRGDPIYSWPLDLPRPTLVILLTVSETVRQHRVQDREDTGGLEQTAEENRLKQDALFRKRIVEAYRRMEGVNIVEIPADGNVSEVVKSALNEAKDHHRHLPTPLKS